MFTAILYACLGVGMGCVTVEDKWGPYDTLHECRERLEDMIETLEEMPFKVSIEEAKCKISSNGKRSA